MTPANATVRARVWRSRNTINPHHLRWMLEVRDNGRLIMIDRRGTQQSALSAACHHIRLQADLNAETPKVTP